MNRYQISTPEGTRDLLFAPARRLRAVEQRVRQSLEGYSEVITPAMRHDVFAQANPAIGQENMLKIRSCRTHLRGASGQHHAHCAHRDHPSGGAEAPVRLYYSQGVSLDCRDTDTRQCRWVPS
ncbi:hypothetical protein [Butyricicoccus pullicaecorum]|uniref:hypothetical protein n=1 Tax=Butyricicoccus pullicaecorum TaxID=501571 RepID=UPI003990C5BB